MESGPSWKKLQLSLERPYKDDDGLPLPVVLDILPDGEHIWEPCVYLLNVSITYRCLTVDRVESPGAKIGEDLRRIFQERGLDFFEQREEQRTAKPFVVHDDVSENTSNHRGEGLDLLDVKPMSPEELYKMRMDILPQLQ